MVKTDRRGKKLPPNHPFSSARIIFGGARPKSLKENLVEQSKPELKEQVEIKGKEVPSLPKTETNLSFETLGEDTVNDMSDIADEIRENGQMVLCLGWDGGMPGMSGGVWVLELNGSYLVSSSDYDPQGPFESLDEALRCECFSVPTAEAELSSEVLSFDQLYDIAKGVADSENDGIVMINDEQHIFIKEK